MKPTDWGHPQFDPETADAWGRFCAENPYVEEKGRSWRPSGARGPENS